MRMPRRRRTKDVEETATDEGDDMEVGGREDRHRAYLYQDTDCAICGKPVSGREKAVILCDGTEFGDGRWANCIITAVYGNDTYDILYDNLLGYQYDVPANYIRRKHDVRASKKTGTTFLVLTKHSHIHEPICDHLNGHYDDISTHRDPSNRGLALSAWRASNVKI